MDELLEEMDHYQILIFVFGEWCVWRQGIGTRKAAEASLAFWSERFSHPVKLVKSSEE